MKGLNHYLFLEHQRKDYRDEEENHEGYECKEQGLNRRHEGSQRQLAFRETRQAEIPQAQKESEWL